MGSAGRMTGPRVITQGWRLRIERRNYYEAELLRPGEPPSSPRPAGPRGGRPPRAREAECFAQAPPPPTAAGAVAGLRAATSLGCLWQRQGKGADAGRLLAEVYGWFTEGFDTPDLREAKSLLEAWP
jgi:adenylate cyclase